MTVSSLVQNVSYAQIAAPLIVAAGAVAVLVAEVFLPPRRKPLVSWLSLLVLAGAAAPDIALWPGRTVGTFCMPQSAASLYSLGMGEPRTLPSTCSYVADRFTLIFQFIALAGAFIVVLMSAASMKRDRIPTGEYHFLLLSSVAGVLVLAASRDLITLTVALETVSLPAFALVGLKRWSGRSSEAALKFFLVSVASTAVMLFGISLVYGATGNVHFGPVALHLHALNASAGGPIRHLAYLGVGMTLVGFGFKVSAVPFHFWTPDTYAGAPVPIAAYLSVVSKAAGFAGLILLTGTAFSPLLNKTGPLLAVLAALTMSLGNLVALRQRDAVRLLAWSTIGQAGYILVPLAAHDSVSYTKHINASIAYIIMYAAMNLGAFAVVHSVHDTRLEAYRGLAKTRPLASAALAFFLLCLAGLPPGLMGLFAKVAVFGAAAGSHLVWLAVVMAVNVVIALYYYLSWTAILFAAPGEATASVGRSPATLRFAIGLTMAAAVLFSVWPQSAFGAFGAF
ncbi:NADH-quinone oxidoreductase subunit N [Catenulispora sp. MAP5-51]|uniref:NADH-quinone oxidoreductase subunit N n=1 Tax=Catenulispora sp. MAP5-51 TaxID=3156298 RepID=UPI0035152A9C